MRALLFRTALLMQENGLKLLVVQAKVEYIASETLITTEMSFLLGLPPSQYLRQLHLPYVSLDQLQETLSKAKEEFIKEKEEAQKARDEAKMLAQVIREKEEIMREREEAIREKEEAIQRTYEAMLAKFGDIEGASSVNNRAGEGSKGT